MAADGPVPLRLTDANIHDATLRTLDDGSWEVRTTGPDPYVFTEPLNRTLDPRLQHMLAFEFFSTTGTGPLQVFVHPPLSEANSVKGEGLPIGQGWTWHSVDLQPVLEELHGKVGGLRLDFGSEPGKVVRIRSLQIRPETEQEAQLRLRREALRGEQARAEARLRDYLAHTYPAEVKHVAVGADRITISGVVTSSPGTVMLAEVPMWADPTDLKAPTIEHLRVVGRRGQFMEMVDRYRVEGGRKRDRLLSRWAVVRKEGAGYVLMSHARYADEVTTSLDLPEERPRTKKGLGGFSIGRPLSDLDDLGISAVTVNILLNGVLSESPGPGRTPFEYEGRTWYANDGFVADIDKAALEAARRHIVVLAIVLVAQGGNAPAGSWSKLVAHPDADPAGIFVMPNVSDQAGLEAYAAALDFLAKRYSRPDGKYGRIHHWIMHNEINAGWIWTNAGDKPALLYMDLYHKSMRAAQLIARQYDGNAKAFISLEHHWTMRPDRHFYPGRELLDLLLDFSRAEGDFEWAIAFHPYPQNLFDPRVWADTQVNYTLSTPKITFKNLEVLDAWVKQPRTWFLGKRPRVVHLSEQGLNSPDYTEKSLKEQAAGMAYAWQKVKHLDSIEAFEYHNWVDNRGEGGLRIGLRRFPDDPEDPLGKKPIWYVYQALGTPKEAEATVFALPIIGIKSWDEALYKGPIRP